MIYRNRSLSNRIWRLTPRLSARSSKDLRLLRARVSSLSAKGRTCRATSQTATSSIYKGSWRATFRHSRAGENQHVGIVRNGGGFRGTCVADHAEVHGVVEGGIVVHGLLDVRSSGHVAGNITYEQLSVAVGAHVSGQLETPAAVAAAHHGGGSGTNIDPNRDSHNASTAMTPLSESKSNGAFPSLS